METILSEPRAAIDDPDLVERFRNGDEAAFQVVVTSHRQVVYSMARRLLRSHEEADEAAQRAFVRAWQARRQFRGDAALRTWLVRIVLNVAKSMLAQRPGDETLGDRPDGRVDSDAPDSALRSREIRARVRAAVRKLPPRQREVVTLKAFAEWTYREVAGSLGLSEGAVKAHFHQAVSNLRRIMNEAGVGEGQR